METVNRGNIRERELERGRDEKRRADNKGNHM